MKRANKTNIVIVFGDNNKVSFGNEKSFFSCKIALLAISMVLLAISLCCPEQFADFVRAIISIILNN